jgi:hypothetical protein
MTLIIGLSVDYNQLISVLYLKGIEHRIRQEFNGVMALIMTKTTREKCLALIFHYLFDCPTSMFEECSSTNQKANTHVKLADNGKRKKVLLRKSKSTASSSYS